MKQKKTNIEKMAIGIILTVIIIMILSIVFSLFVGVFFINNPESIGEWFSKLFGGFNINE